MEATVLIGTFHAAEMFLYPSPDLCLDTILSWRSIDNSLDFMAWFVLWHALFTVGTYIDRCVPFQIMSNQLNLLQVDSIQVLETSQGWSVETGRTWAQFWVSWQRLWKEYLCTCDFSFVSIRFFFFFSFKYICKDFQQTSFTMSLCVIVCRILKEVSYVHQAAFIWLEIQYKQYIVKYYYNLK